MGVSATTIRTMQHESRKRLGLKGKGQGALFNVLLKHGWIDEPAPVVEVPGYGTWLQGSIKRSLWRPSAAQRVYLTAFSKALVQRDRLSLSAMRAAFALMCWEAGVIVPQRPPIDTAVEHFDATLLRIARGVTRSIPA